MAHYIYDTIFNVSELFFNSEIIGQRVLYVQVEEAKEESYPSGITISKIVCKVPLQGLINHTVCRLMKYSTIEDPGKFNGLKLKLIFKCGFGGSNASIYKQRAQDNVRFSSGDSVHLYCLYYYMKKVLIRLYG